jgi:hypothetical protein
MNLFIYLFLNPSFKLSCFKGWNMMPTLNQVWNIQIWIFLLICICCFVACFLLTCLLSLSILITILFDFSFKFDFFHFYFFLFVELIFLGLIFQICLLLVDKLNEFFIVLLTCFVVFYSFLNLRFESLQGHHSFIHFIKSSLLWL